MPDMAATNAVTGVIFDVDGVLVDSAAPHFESWRQLGSENGTVVTQERFATTFGRHNRDIIPLLFGEVSQQQITALSERKEEIYRGLIRTAAPIVGGAADLVRSLHDAGVRLAVGSSAPRENIDLVLEALGVRGLFSVIVSADDVQRGKPDPQVFVLACERLGIPKERCVVIEDAPAGVEAARAAGARCVAVMIHHGPQALRRADLRVGKLSDLTVGMITTLANE